MALTKFQKQYRSNRSNNHYNSYFNPPALGHKRIDERQFHLTTSFSLHYFSHQIILTLQYYIDLGNGREITAASVIEVHTMHHPFVINIYGVMYTYSETRVCLAMKKAIKKILKGVMIPIEDGWFNANEFLQRRTTIEVHEANQNQNYYSSNKQWCFLHFLNLSSKKTQKN